MSPELLETRAGNDAVGRRAFVVVGMHRSGTSAMTRTLSLLGASLPKQLLGPQDCNPKGFWESEAITDLNEEILHSIDSQWDDIFSFRASGISDISRRHLGRAVELLLREFKNSDLIVVKDPRISVLTSVWDRALRHAGYEPHYIFMVRNPLEIADSLRKRDGFPTNKSLLLWASYLVAAERGTVGSERTFVSYDQLISNWRSIQKKIEESAAVRFPISLKVEREIDKFLDSSLRHYSKTSEDLFSRADITEEVKTLYRIFCGACEGSDIDGAAVEAVRNEFERAERGFGPIIDDLRSTANRLAKELAAASERIESAETRGAILENELASERTRLAEEVLAKHREVEDLLRAYESTQAEFDRFRADSEVRAAAQHDLLERARLELSELRDRAAGQEHELANAEVRAAAQHDLLEQARLELSELRDRAAGQEHELANLRTEFANELDGVTDLNSTLTQQAVEAEKKMTSERERHVAEKDELTVELSRLRDHVVELGMELRKQNDKVMMLNSAVNRANENLRAVLTSFSWKLTSPLRACRRLVSSASLRFVRRSVNPLFDTSWYLQQYPDVELGERDPYDHFLRHGAEEGRNPNSFFDTRWYLQQYPDVQESGMNPLIHYWQHGAAEGRNPNASFDTRWYQQQYPDVKESGVNPLLHYWLHGAAEGRIGSPDHRSPPKFDNVPRKNAQQSHHASDEKGVFAAREDEHIASAPLQSSHSINHNLRRDISLDAQMKALSDHFDAEFYVSENSDVREAKLNPLKHYTEHGWREGRNPSPLFWTTYYRRKYKDVEGLHVNPFYHYVTVGRHEGRKPNPIGTTLWERPEAPSDQDWESVFAAKDVPDAEIAVIIPVYKGFADTLAAIHAVLRNRQETPFRLIVINDHGPDKKLNKKLRELSEQELFSYYVNDTNLGFSGTVNRGIEYAGDLDVILLNSDTVVFGDWIDRFRAHAERDPSVATITPFSNNATICSYPNKDLNNLIKIELSPAEIDEYTRFCNHGMTSTLPTGIGFCFFVRRAAIDKIGNFDSVTFPRGYGEENDFCMRAIKAGFKNVFAHDVFVYHTGCISFAGIANSAMTSGHAELLKKHPDYLTRVKRYIQADPAREARMRLDLYRLAKSIGSNSVVFVTHEFLGGIETHTQRLGSRLEEEGVNVLYLRCGAPDKVRLEALSKIHEIYLPSIESISISKYDDLVSEFLRWLEPKFIHVHSFAGLNWSSTKKMMNVVRHSRTPYYFTVHDFAAICHRYDFINPEGVYCGQPGASDCASCIRMDHSCVDVVDPEVRWAQFDSFLSAAVDVFVPSKDTAARIRRVFPSLTTTIRPHDEAFSCNVSAAVAPKFVEPLRVVLIGAIGPHKGSAVLHDLAVDARERSLPIEFTIIGYSNFSAAGQALGIRETGRYGDDEEVFQLLDDLKPHIAFFPSICPETYCYTLSVALAAGIPAVAFDTGAPAERLRELRSGYILDNSLVSDPVALNDALLELPLDKLWANRRELSGVSYSTVLGDYYRLRGGSASARGAVNGEVEMRACL